MDYTALQSIKRKYGNRATDSPLDCELYSRDLAPIPSLLVKPLFQTKPDLIVRPASSDEISDLMKWAYGANIPVTPRASGSTVFFNAVPVKGGLLMDLSLLEGIVELDEIDRTVTVRAATTWKDLEEYLNKRNFACKSMPSSAPSATVGGWLCMMGYGIGSLKYGSLLSQVKTIEIVLPDGRIQKVTRESSPPLEWFSASEGTLGIVTEIELEVRPLTTMKHFLFHALDISTTLQLITNVLDSEVVPYNMHFADAHYLKTLKSLGFSDLDVKTGSLVAVDYEGPASELSIADKFLETISTSVPSVTLLAEEVAKEEWQERFRAIRFKRGGPSALGGEIWLPVVNLPGYLKEIENMIQRHGLSLMSYGHLVSPEHATVMTMFFSDETRLTQYLLDLSLVKKIHDIGYRYKGSPYGIGLWNTPYIGRIHSKSMLKKMRERKRELDPQNIMNPGKIYQPPGVLNPFVFHMGMEVTGIAHRFFRKRK